MDNPDITMEKYIQLEAEKPRRRGHEINWETATYGKVRYFEDMEYFKYFKNEFPAIVYNDALTLELEISSEPTIIMLEYRPAFATHDLAHKRSMEDHTEQVPGEF
ncbi:hypothetical protein Tco_0793302 [Tanacetum coccineum]